MSAVDGGLQDLRCRHPEWEPWLGVVQQALRESAAAGWETVVPDCAEIQAGKIPLLAGADIHLEKKLLRSWFERLIRAASLSGTEKLATLRSLLSAELDFFSLFKSSLEQDDPALKQLADSFSIDPEGFQAVTGLFSVPFLQACNRAWAGITAASWMEGYCPVCGSWPAFAEMRGIERNRYLRCGRCGGEWLAHVLLCPYCANSDHERQAALVADNGTKSAAVEVCNSCLGYVKVFTVLQGSACDKVLVEDLSSVELDLAAAEQGYRRPQGSGFSLDLTVSELRRRKFF